jgi:pyridoxamine 5'-phosphate oxidase
MIPWNEPFDRFASVFARARATEPHDATAVSLATATADGVPSVRVVLLKGVDPRGFVFYTNRQSRKGVELDKNPRAALCFYWPTLGEQVRVEGATERVSDAESDAYFGSRPRESQLGAWASRQSRPLERYELLQERLKDLDEQWKGEAVPRPRWWGGTRVLPEVIEFWVSGPSRLHRRERYDREGHEGEPAGWRLTLLNP